jgi:methyltransferase-like protein
MLLYHVGGGASGTAGGEPQARIRKSREFLNLMAELVAPPGGDTSPYGVRLRSEAELINAQDDAYVFHEYLEEFNQPLYFYQFAERAARHGLQYLADADRGLRSLEALPPPVLEAMRRHADGIVAREQLLDFYTNHTFRSTLLVAAGDYVDRAVSPDRLRELYITSSLTPDSPTPDVTGAVYETFVANDTESTFASAHPVTKAAVLVLREAYPQALPFDELVARACARAYPRGDLGRSKVTLTREADVLARNLLQGHTADSALIDFHAHRPALAAPAQVGERPAALASARYEALRSRSVTNAYHRPVRLGPLSWYLLPFLDGTRDVDALVALAMANQTLALEKAGEELSDPDVKRPLMRAEVSSSLAGLARAALLSAPPGA